MENLSIKSKQRLPSIEFYSSSGILEIKGRSLQGSDPEYSELYDQVLNWIENYAQQPAEKTIMSVQLDYYCTATSKNLLLIFQELEKILLSGYDVSINWICLKDDEDMTEAGLEYKEILKVPVDVVYI